MCLPVFDIIPVFFTFLDNPRIVNDGYRKGNQNHIVSELIIIVIVR